MQEIVDRVLQAEQKAKVLLEEARRKAAEARSAAEKKISQKLKNTRAEAQKLIQDSITAAKEKADQKCRQAAKKAEAENAEFMDRNREQIALLVEKVAALVITPEYKKG